MSDDEASEEARAALGRGRPRPLRKNTASGQRGAPPFVPTSRPPGETGPYDETETIVDALLDMAGDDLVALPPEADDEALDHVLGIAVLAYNHPLDSLVPRKRGEPLSHGEMMLRVLAATFARSPRLAAQFHRMLDVRTKRYGHLTALPSRLLRHLGEELLTVDIEVTPGRLPLDDEGGRDHGENLGDGCKRAKKPTEEERPQPVAGSRPRQAPPRQERWRSPTR